MSWAISSVRRYNDEIKSLSASVTTIGDVMAAADTRRAVETSRNRCRSASVCLKRAPQRVAVVPGSGTPPLATHRALQRRFPHEPRQRGDQWLTGVKSCLLGGLSRDSRVHPTRLLVVLPLHVGDVPRQSFGLTTSREGHLVVLVDDHLPPEALVRLVAQFAR